MTRWLSGIAVVVFVLVAARAACAQEELAVADRSPPLLTVSARVSSIHIYIDDGMNPFTWLGRCCGGSRESGNRSGLPM